MAQASVDFIVSLYNFTRAFPETELFLKELVFDHIVQFPEDKSSKALIHVIEKHVRKARRTDVWMTPPFL